MNFKHLSIDPITCCREVHIDKKNPKLTALNNASIYLTLSLGTMYYMCVYNTYKSLDDCSLQILCAQNLQSWKEIAKKKIHNFLKAKLEVGT